jgi:hypothetical protein
MNPEKTLREHCREIGKLGGSAERNALKRMENFSK